MTRICIVQGHPTAGGGHFCHALAQAYAEGAGATAHEVKTLSVATMDFPQLRTKQDWDTGRPPIVIVEAQETIRWAEHFVIIFPLWIGAMPALLKGFFEQTLRPGFAMALTPNGGWTKLLAGRSARVIVTMGMPAVVYRWYFGAPGLKSLTQNLALVGIKPRRPLLVGSIEAMGDARRRNWLQRLHRLGREAA
jgi:putative NADPH-quinone reductase